MEQLYPEYDLEFIDNSLSLRPPQSESLKILDKIINETDIFKDYDMPELLKQIHALYPTMSGYDKRNFPSLCFALATGVGKTRLMAAFITYLYTQYGIKDYFVLAPNLTIYNKLIRDFGDPSYEKYLFKGIDIFTHHPPRIVTGDTYKEQVAGQQSIKQSIEINIFNISKINKKEKGEVVPNIKKLSEFIGDSYFNYLSNLENLVVIMDESHHYRADRGMEVINELNPFLGLELTATPQTETSKGAVKFKNVVYEYSLAKAIADGYVKEPFVATRVDFDPSKYKLAIEIDRFKLIDAARMHQQTKLELELYSKKENKKLVKPFMLVVCRDTTHAAEIKEYIQSDLYFKGYYADKVIEVHSNQTGSEKDENIDKLLNLESETNNIEIVIHVNMLKEGWDVTNLYTIVPLRTAASTTLREQTIGRGLRLPYGTKTKVDALDRLTIIAHDRFEEIIKAANDESSIIKQKNIINIEDIEDFGKEREISPNKTTGESFIIGKQMELDITTDEQKKKDMEQDIEVLKVLSQVTDEVVHKAKTPAEVAKTDGKTFTFAPFTPSQTTPPKVEITKSEDLNNIDVKGMIVKKAVEQLTNKQQISLFDEKKEDIEKKVEQLYSTFVQQKLKSTIDIPDIALIPLDEVTYEYKDFDIDLIEFNFKPVSEDILLESLKDNKSERLSGSYDMAQGESIESLIVGELISYDLTSMSAANELIYKLIEQVKRHFQKRYTDEQIKNIFVYHKQDIAKEIYRQMTEPHHFVTIPPKFNVKMLNPIMPILTSDYTKYREDEILDFKTSVPASDITKKIFGGFERACHNTYKFDSEPEQIFAIIAERDNDIIKWLRPAPKQFKIWWGGGQNYEPDFVVETADSIFIVEIKAHNQMKNEEVMLKAKAARAFCENVNKVNAGTDKKVWKYMLVTDGEVNRNTTFGYLVKEVEFYSYH